MYINAALLFLGLFLFIFSNPNFLFLEGIPIFAYFMLIPISLLTNKVKNWQSFVFGVVFGFVATFLYSFWLIKVRFIILLFVSIIESIEYGITFMLLSVANKKCLKHSYLVQWLIWCSFEFLRTKGFLGLSYGNLAYTQYNFNPILRFSSLFGIWGVNLLVSFPSFYISRIITEIKSKKRTCICETTSICIWFFIFLCVICFGNNLEKQSVDEKVKILLVQPNEEGCGNLDKIKDQFERYKKLINSVIEEDSDIDLIVLPEASIKARMTFRERDFDFDEQEEAARYILDYFYSIKIPVLFGTRERICNGFINNRYDYTFYNSAMLLDSTTAVMPPNVQIYRKRHLVPFSEYIPGVKYNGKKRKILSKFTIFSPGKEVNLLSIKNIKFGVPICFEEAFGRDLLHMDKLGADFFLSISNDMWAKSEVCQQQHYAITKFRAAEFNKPFLRCSTSGQSYHLDNNGELVQGLDAYKPGTILCDVSICRDAKRTLYSIAGDILGYLTVFAAILLFTVYYNNGKRKKK